MNSSASSIADVIDMSGEYVEHGDACASTISERNSLETEMVTNDVCMYHMLIIRQEKLLARQQSDTPQAKTDPNPKKKQKNEGGRSPTCASAGSAEEIIPGCIWL